MATTHTAMRSSPQPLRWPARLARIATVLCILAILFLAVAGPGYRLRLLPLVPALLGAVAGFLLFILAFIVGLVGYLGGRRGSIAAPRGAGVAVILAGIVTLFAGFFILHARGAPPIHDITTDLEDPPTFKDVLALRTAAGAQNPPDYRRVQNSRGVDLDVSAAQRSAYPGIRSFDTAEQPARALQLAEQAARKLGWDIVAIAPAEGRLEATDTTLYFGFKDDVVVRVRPTAQGSRVDVRSESRVGLGDAGTNAKRTAKFLATLRGLARAPGTDAH
jgi:uncharacterized protein (DUF1499 family)